VPLALQKEVPGFVINRLQAAFRRECVHLVREGVVTVEELDSNAGPMCSKKCRRPPGPPPA